MSAICIIPARGGSVRVPRKNILPIGGKPMIAYPIQAALDSHLFARVVVSTDDDEIACVARNFGAETPFVRPAHLADAHTGTQAVIAHALETLGLEGHRFDHCCALYATAVLITDRDLRASYEMLLSEKCFFVFSVVRYPHPPERALGLNRQGRLASRWPNHRTTRTQDLTASYFDAGQFYWGKSEAFLTRRDLFDGTALPFEFPHDAVVDVDTPDDLRVLERRLANR